MGPNQNGRIVRSPQFYPFAYIAPSISSCNGCRKPESALQVASNTLRLQLEQWSIANGSALLLSNG